MAIIIKKEKIIDALKTIDVVAAMKEGFIHYSNGKTVVPPVVDLLFEKPPGEVHIKYGYLKEDDFYVIKIASGFYGNTQMGISSSQGMMLVFSQKTGQALGVLLDEGLLTDIRTAAAGALAAQYFAPKNIKAIGLIGTGIQARLQLQYLRKVRPCKNVWIWGRNTENAQRFKKEFKNDYDIQIAESTSTLAQHCNLIVTTTPSNTPLLFAKDIQAGTHITAVGSDIPEKQELESAILRKADLVIADSIPQSKSRGEIFKASQQAKISEAKVIAFGKAIQDTDLQRKDDQQISVVDLTGVAVQDIMIAKEVYLNLKNKISP